MSDHVIDQQKTDFEPPPATDKPLYSINSISFGTYLGGPLATAIFARRNFLNLGDVDGASRALTIGIISMILVIVGLAHTPEEIIDKVPNAVIPIIYTVIGGGLVGKAQGKALEAHKKAGGAFYSGWKVAGVSIGSALIFVAGIFGYLYLLPEDFDTQQFRAGLVEFDKNESEALGLFQLLESDDSSKIVEFIDSTGLPKWHRNVELMTELHQIEGLYPDLQKLTQDFREYSELRVTSYELIRKALIEDTDRYATELEAVNSRIEAFLSRNESKTEPK